MFTIRTTSVTFSSEPIDGSDKKKVTLSLVVPIVSSEINETFNTFLRFDEMLTNDSSPDTQSKEGTGWDTVVSDDKLSHIVTFKFIL